MTAPSTSEINGTFQAFSASDLLAETMQSGLSGSLRLAHQDEKVIVYLHEGRVVFAVSNLRQHRLFQMLLQNQAITKEALSEIPNFTSDFELAGALVERGIFDKASIDSLFDNQLSQIIRMVLDWQTGTWAFNHLARAKESMHFKFDPTTIMVEHVRAQSDEVISRKFRSNEEKFVLRGAFRADLPLQSEEGYLLSRLDTNPVRIEDIKTHSGMPAALTLKILYLLWVGGFLLRQNWQSVFSDSKLKELLSAKLTLITPTKTPEIEVENKEAVTPDSPVKNLEPEVDETALLLQYLDNVESAESYYEILGVPVKAELPEIKMAYFKLAKSYHPDKFHHQGNSERQQRIQNAFTEIARAYETLKDEKARELYDFKLRKYLESIKEQEKSKGRDGANQKIEPDRAKSEFDQGFSLMLNHDYDNAIPFLARSVQLSPDNARYHAYHGKALSFSKNQRFKAESEINVAIKLEPENVAHRIMLVEFYVQFNLHKRAEGELQRTLAAFPGNKEVLALLDSLEKS